ncbi:MAG: type IX secretion system membrane protein PorP/SprF [Flavobacteriales bacterium]|nr:type IX secretion system membrane protein PorP/SprF [Flavobacteriales bacterium]
MRRLLVIAALVVGALGSEAQQLPQYTHFVTNYFQYNPAVAGSAACLDLKIGYRKQWMNVSGAPSTAFANAHGNFGKKKRKGYNFHGIGGIVETDNAGRLSYTSVHLAYAYHMRISRKYMLSAGLAAGIYQYRFDFAEVNVVDDFNTDDALVNAMAQQFIYPQINLGFWLYRDDRFFGFSMRNVVANKIDGLGDESKTNTHFEFTAGKIIELNEDFKFKPAAQVKYVRASKMALDVQAMIDFREKFQIGVGFRSGNGISALVQIDMFRYITVGYAYDLTLSKMRYNGMHTHEIVLGISACPDGDGNKIPCAAYN